MPTARITARICLKLKLLLYTDVITISVKFSFFSPFLTDGSYKIENWPVLHEFDC